MCVADGFYIFFGRGGIVVAAVGEGYPNMMLL